MSSLAEHSARRASFRIRLQLANVGDEDHLEQLEILLLLADTSTVTVLPYSSGIRSSSVSSRFFLCVGVLLVDFVVDRHHDRHACGRAIDRFTRLWHHAIVGGHHITTRSVTLAPRASAECGVAEVSRNTMLRLLIVT